MSQKVLKYGGKILKKRRVYTMTQERKVLRKLEKVFGVVNQKID